MTAGEVLERCEREGVTLTPTPHGTLKVRGQRLPPELLEAVRATKPEILRLLRDDKPAPDVAEVYERAPQVDTRRVRIEAVAGAGVTGGPAYRLVSAVDGKPLLVGLFAAESWAVAWCGEHGLTLMEAGSER